MPLLTDYITPSGAGTGTVPWVYPGTNRPITAANDFGINTKEGMDAFNAMLWRESGGLSGAPMPQEPLPPVLRSRIPATPSVPGPALNRGAYPNPVVRSAINGYNNGYRVTPSPTLNVPNIQSGLTTVVKSPGQQSRLNANLAQFSGPVGQAKQQSLTEYTKEYLADRPSQKAAYQQESNFIGRTFDRNGLEADLAGIARNRSLLGRQAAADAIARARRERSVSGMVSGTPGGSSYLDRAYADALSKIMLDQALKNSDIERENAVYVQGQRNGSVGARGRLGRDYVEGGLAPYRNLTELQAGDLGNLGRIGNIEDNYSLYDYVQPDEASRRRLNLLSDLDQMNTRYPYV